MFSAGSLGAADSATESEGRSGRDTLNLGLVSWFSRLGLLGSRLLALVFRFWSRLGGSGLTGSIQRSCRLARSEILRVFRRIVLVFGANSLGQIADCVERGLGTIYA